jgi:flagellar biosynthesis GTPase FlhF
LREEIKMVKKSIIAKRRGKILGWLSSLLDRASKIVGRRAILSLEMSHAHEIGRLKMSHANEIGRLNRRANGLLREGVDAFSYKTQKDLDEIAERIAKALNREGRAQLKAEATEAERQKRRRESERRDSERRKYNERVAWERRVARKEEQARIKAAERMRQRPNYGPPQRPTPAEQAAERTRDETIARRMRQKEAMDAGKEFSITQDGRTIIVTWDDRRITDERLVRLVLSAEGWGAPSRKMTEEEEQDYWYWKARGR